MRTRPPKHAKSDRLLSVISLKLALVALGALLLIALPQILSARAGAAPIAPQGFLFTVTTLDDHNDFVCDGTDCTLREAIQAANNAPTDDTIDFSVTGTINLGSALPDITDSVTIEGPGADMMTVRRTANSFFRVFNVTTTGTVTFSALTITGGQFDVDTAGEFGAGIQNFSTGTVNVDNCTIAVNQANFGSGIANRSSGVLNVTNSRLNRNISDFGGGGGIYNESGTVTITNSTISDGGAGDSSRGGGILNNMGRVNVISSTITNNFANLGGGGIYTLNPGGVVSITDSTISVNSGAQGGGIFIAGGGTVDVTNSTINGNGAGSGGGVYVEGGTLNVTNCTMSSNLARVSTDGIGGGIFNAGFGTVNLTNSTITANVSRGKGGGIANLNSPGNSPGTFNVKSSIIALNNAASDGPEGVGPFTSAGFNLIGRADSSTVGFTQPTDLVGTIFTPLEPGLDPNGLQDNGGPTKAIALVCGSQAIDRGTSQGLTGNLTTDQRGSGFPRTIDDPLTQNASGGDGTDIGAFELMVCNHPPVAQCKNIQVSAGLDCQASITAAAVDNGSFDPDPGDSILMRTLDNSGPFGLGPHTVTLTVIDTHGSFSFCTATVTVVDTTPPSITCPANVIIKTPNPGSSTVVVNYPPPTASDNCPGVVVVCSPPSGSQFPLGSTMVTCTATDGAMNKSTCTFTVTAFDVCLQDDSSRNTLLFNSQSGDYLFTKCGASGFTLSGKGTVRIQGSIFTLEHYGSDRRVTAKLDNGLKRGTASVQYFPLGTTFTITDRNTTDNTCACQ